MTLEQPPPPPRLSSCHLHPDQPVTGFCASCLRERLTKLIPPPTSDPKPSTSAALKSIFKPKASKPPAASESISSRVLPQLRRSKSFSGVKPSDGIPVIFEPQRRSCDVRSHDSSQPTLETLFNQDADGRAVDSRFFGVEKEIEEEGEIRAVEAIDFGEETQDAKAMKDRVVLDGQMKNPTVEKPPSAIAGSFRLAAAVFGRKLQKWRGKKKGGPQAGDRTGAMKARDEKPQNFRDTQSEVADYGFGRRSCDTGPRFSLDAGRVSFDDPRCSFDGPRASWDGYLMGRVGLPRMTPMMGSVVEDGPAVIGRSDDKILVESINEDPEAPGGTVQTREYYSNSPTWQPRRRSFERSSSMRKAGAAMAKFDETKSVSSSKLSTPSIDYFHRNKIADSRDLNMNLHSNSLRDDSSEIYESRDLSASGRKGSKKSSRWSKAFNIWGLINRRSGGSKEDDAEYDDSRSQCSRRNVVERSFSESWRREVNVESKMAFDHRKVFRSNSSVSWRNSSNNGRFENMKVSESNGHSKKRREEPVLERNRSARYSPSKFDNGLLRFYLAPLSSSRRSASGSEKGASKNSHLFAKSMLRMY